MPQIIGQTSIGQAVPVEILRTYTGWALCRPLEPLPNLDAETYLPTGHALLHLSSRRLWVSVFKTTFEQPEVDFEPFIDWMVARGVQPAESWVSIRRLGDTEVPPPKTRSRKGLAPPSLARALGKGWTPGKIINPETGQREWIGTDEHQGQRRRQIIEPGTRKRKQPAGPIEQQVDATPPQETTPMSPRQRHAEYAPKFTMWTSYHPPVGLEERGHNEYYYRSHDGRWVVRPGNYGTMIVRDMQQNRTHVVEGKMPEAEAFVRQFMDAEDR